MARLRGRIIIQSRYLGGTCHRPHPSAFILKRVFMSYRRALQGMIRFEDFRKLGTNLQEKKEEASAVEDKVLLAWIKSIMGQQN